MDLYQYFNEWVSRYHQTQSTNIPKKYQNKVDWLANSVYEPSNIKKNIWTIGIGKSGLVGEYFSQMLQSMGIMCHALHPTNALHGDIGAVRDGDLVIFISKGGRNPEFTNIVSSCKNRNISVLALCCSIDSLLVKNVGRDNSIILPTPVEDHDWNVMPTTSILCFHYYMMLVIKQIKLLSKLSKSQYYQYHPKGAIGELLHHYVRDVMKPLPTDCLHLDSTLQEALLYLTHHRLACCILVDKDNRLKGIFSDRDIRECLLKKRSLDTPLRNIAHKANVTTTPETPLSVLANRLHKVDLKYLSGIPVLEDERVVGLINHKILIRHCQHLLN